MTDDLPRQLDEIWTLELAAVDGRRDSELARSTRTAWTVRELLFHQLLDAQRSLVALASPASDDEAPDVDAVTYWAPFRPEAPGSAAHEAFVRVAASAYGSAAALIGHLRTTTSAAARAVATADPAARVRTQGHVVTVADLASTLVVEATVHLLDLTVDLPGAPAPPAAALTETRRVLEAIEGGPLPAHWDDTEAVLRGTGRLPGWRSLLG